MTPKSTLHIPRPSARPGDAPDFDYLSLSKAGEVRYALGIGGDTSQGAPGDALEYSAAAGSAAFIFGADEDLIVGKSLLKSGEIDLGELDEAVDRLVAKLLRTMPNCTRKTIESMRKHKLAQWDKNRESNRSWLGRTTLARL